MGDQLDLLTLPPAHDPGGRIRVRWPADSVVTARFSECRRYRLELREVWDPSAPLWLWLMTNPSVADLAHSDPTLAKTGRISRLNGAGGQIIVNSGAYRSTSPAALAAVRDPIGVDNEVTVLRLARLAYRTDGKIVAAYGQPPPCLAGVGLHLCRKMAAEGIPLHVLRLSLDGTPMHPLSRGKGHIPITTELVPWLPGGVDG